MQVQEKETVKNIQRKDKDLRNQRKKYHMKRCLKIWQQVPKEKLRRKRSLGKSKAVMKESKRN